MKSKFRFPEWLDETFYEVSNYFASCNLFSQIIGFEFLYFTLYTDDGIFYDFWKAYLELLYGHYINRVGFSMT